MALQSVLLKAVCCQGNNGLVKVNICIILVLLYSYSFQTYGKGTGKDCRRHVQKLNMLRSAKNKEADSNYCNEQHPPQDYASTFTAQEGDTDTLDVVCIAHHLPVHV